MVTPNTRAVAVVLLAVLLLFAVGGCGKQSAPKPITLTEPARQDVAQPAAQDVQVEEAETDSARNQPEESGSAATVYITRTGKCYHADGCGSLSRSRIPISLSDAKDRGYRACQRCGGGG